MLLRDVNADTRRKTNVAYEINFLGDIPQPIPIAVDLNMQC